MSKIKIPEGWVFKYFQVEDGLTKFVYEDNLGQEHIYINQEIEQDIPSYEDLQNRISKAIEYMERYMPNYDFDKTNLIKVLDILKGADKE